MGSAINSFVFVKSVGLSDNIDLGESGDSCHFPPTGNAC